MCWRWIEATERWWTGRWARRFKQSREKVNRTQTVSRRLKHKLDYRRGAVKWLLFASAGNMRRRLKRRTSRISSASKLCNRQPRCFVRVLAKRLSCTVSERVAGRENFRKQTAATFCDCDWSHTPCEEVGTSLERNISDWWTNRAQIFWNKNVGNSISCKQSTIIYRI